MKLSRRLVVVLLLGVLLFSSAALCLGVLADQHSGFDRMPWSGATLSGPKDGDVDEEL